MEYLAQGQGFGATLLGALLLALGFVRFYCHRADRSIRADHERTMTMTTETSPGLTSLAADVRRAIRDPGAVVGTRIFGSDYEEDLSGWQTRAVMVVIDQHDRAREQATGVRLGDTIWTVDDAEPNMRTIPVVWSMDGYKHVHTRRGWVSPRWTFRQTWRFRTWWGGRLRARTWGALLRRVGPVAARDVTES